MNSLNLTPMPSGVAVDTSGHVYVADSSNRTIRKISSAGAVTTIGGTAGVYGGNGGRSSGAKFYTPIDVAVDTKGILYVADADGVILKGTPVPSLPGFESWQQFHFGPGAENSDDAARFSDYDQDGFVNVLEFALGNDPKATSPSPISILTAGAGLLEMRYTRSTAAFNAGTGYTVEWSDNPAGPWSTANVTQIILTEDDLLQQVKAAVPAEAVARRFVRLRITAP